MNDTAGMHELFLPMDEGDATEIHNPAYVSVVRLKPYPDTSGGVWRACDIPDVPTLHAMFGGGMYEVYARDERKRVIARRRIGPLPGKPKPLAIVQDDEPSEEPRAQAFTPPQQAQGASDNASLLAFLAAQQEQQKQFMHAMLERSERTTALVFQTLTEAIKTKVEAPIAIARETQGPDPMTTFLQGVEFARGLIGERAESEEKSEPDDIESTIALVAQGADAFAKIQAMNQPPAPTQPAPPPQVQQNNPAK